jgi:hypothetical protein
MKKIYKSGLAFLLLFTFLSCVEEGTQVPLGAFEQGVLIMNEGAFGSNDGEIYHYNPGSGEIKANIFESKNGRPFAGLIQEMVESDGRLFLVANTGKVEVVDPRDFASIGAVTENLDISRSLVTADQKMYISDWGPYDADFNSPDSYVALINGMEGGEVSKKIQVSSRPEGMFVVGNQILVACGAERKMDVISIVSEARTGSLEVEGIPVRFFEYGGKLYLYARDSETVYFHEVSRSNAQIIETISLSLPLATSNVTLADNGELLIITSTGWPDYNDAIARISLPDRRVLDEAVFTGSGFYGIGYHTELKEIYVGDHNNFQGNGTVLILDQKGQQLRTISSGRAPSGFLIK